MQSLLIPLCLSRQTKSQCLSKFDHPVCLSCLFFNPLSMGIALFGIGPEISIWPNLISCYVICLSSGVVHRWIIIIPPRAVKFQLRYLFSLCKSQTVFEEGFSDQILLKFRRKKPFPEQNLPFNTYSSIFNYHSLPVSYGESFVLISSGVFSQVKHTSYKQHHPI